MNDFKPVVCKNREARILWHMKDCEFMAPGESER